MMAPEQSGKCFSYRLRPRRSQAHATPHGGGSTRQIFYVRREGCWGEASPSTMCGETTTETGRTLDRLLSELAQLPNPLTPFEIAAWLKERFPMAPSARAAIEMAAFDRAARSQSTPLHEFLRLPSPEGLASSYRVMLTSESELETRLDEAREFHSLKIHCSGHPERDLLLIKWIAQHTDKPLRINARGAWRPDEARILVTALSRMRVEYIEQPLARHMVEETAQLMRLSPVPLLLDEDACSAGELNHIAGACNGFVLKLMTSGGIAEALRMIRQGRELGLRIALDTTIESNLATTAAAHLAGAVDYVDLTAPLLLENDPFEGLDFKHGKVHLPSGSGTGVQLRAAYRDCFHHPYGR